MLFLLVLSQLGSLIETTFQFNVEHLKLNKMVFLQTFLFASVSVSTYTKNNQKRLPINPNAGKVY